MMMLCIFILRIEAHAQFVETSYISWSPDGTMLAVGIDERVDIIDVDTLMVMNSLSILTDGRVHITPPSWSSDGDYLAIANGPDVQIWYQPWFVTDSQQVEVYQYYNNDPGPSIRAIDWSPDNNEIAIAVGEFVHVWDVNNSTFLREFWDEWGSITDIVWDIDRIAIATSRTYAINLDPITGEIINYFFTITENTISVNAIDFSPDGNEMAIAINDGLVQIWGDTRTTEQYSGTPRIGFSPEVRVNDVSWSSDGLYIATAGWDGNVIIWDTISGTLIQTIQVRGNVRSVNWSPDGSQLAYGIADGNGVEIIPAPSLSNKSSENSLP